MARLPPERKRTLEAARTHLAARQERCEVRVRALAEREVKKLPSIEDRPGAVPVPPGMARDSDDYYAITKGISPKVVVDAVRESVSRFYKPRGRQARLPKTESVREKTYVTRGAAAFLAPSRIAVHSWIGAGWRPGGGFEKPGVAYFQFADDSNWRRTLTDPVEVPVCSCSDEDRVALDRLLESGQSKEREKAERIMVGCATDAPGASHAQREAATPGAILAGPRRTRRRR